MGEVDMSHSIKRALALCAVVTGAFALTGCTSDEPGGIFLEGMMRQGWVGKQPVFVQNITVRGHRFGVYRDIDSNDMFIRDEAGRTHSCAGNNLVMCTRTAATVPLPRSGGDHSH